MEKTSKDLAAMPADSFLDPELFRTGSRLDTVPNVRETAKYRQTLADCTQWREIHIATNNVWSAHNVDNGHTQSYEKLGYHANTAALLAAFLDSGIPVYVHRDTGKEVTKTRIR